LVEKVRAHESRMLPTLREWDKVSGPDVKGFGVRRSGIFRWGDMRFIVIPHRAHPIWSTYPQSGARCAIWFRGGGGPLQHDSHLRRTPFG
jgi:hypothetical protein